ncbi:universal stress protein [Haloarchaeobius litoreus]|uniref:Universal stress protein n=1 Tax=Haloarchaeobius litoreus TaxID=755306 RepID=A0ABD6DKH3_9EURY|nr:universal stress protein [Haloarchaeobius litoreus]
MSDSPDEQDRPSIGGSKGASKARTLYPIFQRESDTVLGIAGAIAASLDTQLLIGEVETGTDTASYETTRDVAETVLRAREHVAIDADVLGHSLTGPTPIEAIDTAATMFHVNIIVLGNDTSEQLEGLIAKRTGCDTVVVNGRFQRESVASILVPIAGGPHSGAAVNVASAVAAANDARLELVHILETTDSGAGREEAAELLETGAARVPESIDVDTRIIDEDDVTSEIIDESDHHDLTVIGAPRKGTLRRLIFGSKAAEIREQARNTVVMARKGSDPERSLFAGPLDR